MNVWWKGMRKNQDLIEIELRIEIFGLPEFGGTQE